LVGVKVNSNFPWKGRNQKSGAGGVGKFGKGVPLLLLGGGLKKIGGFRKEGFIWKGLFRKN